MEIIIEDGSESAPITLNSLLKVVCKRFDCTKTEILSHRKNAAIAYKRHVLYYLAHKYTDASLPKIGKFMNRDHTSIIHGYKKVERVFAQDPGFQKAEAEMVSEARDLDNLNVQEVVEEKARRVLAAEKIEQRRREKHERHKALLEESEREFKIVSVDGRTWCVPKAARVS